MIRPESAPGRARVGVPDNGDSVSRTAAHLEPPQKYRFRAMKKRLTRVTTIVGATMAVAARTS